MRNRDALVIRTPEGIEFSLPLAGPFSRMLALVIDIAVIIMLGSFLEKLLAPLLVFGQDLADALTVIGYFVISLIYSALAEWRWRGQTVGKRLLRLRVVDARGLRLEPSQVVVRNLMRFVDALPLLYLVGGVACVLSRYRQRLGDLAAGTVVVRTPKLVRPDLVNEPDERQLIEQVARLDRDAVEQMLHAPEVGRACPPDRPEHLVALREQQFGEVGSVLSGNTGDNGSFGHE